MFLPRLFFFSMVSNCQERIKEFEAAAERSSNPQYCFQLSLEDP